MELSGTLLPFSSVEVNKDTQEAQEGSSLTYSFARACHARNIALVLLLHLLLDGVGQLVDLLRLVGALKLSVPVLPAQVAVLVILQGTCSKTDLLHTALCIQHAACHLGRERSLQRM